MASVVAAAFFLAVLPWTWAARGFLGPSLGVPLTLIPAVLLVAVGGVYVVRGLWRQQHVSAPWAPQGALSPIPWRTLVSNPWAYAAFLVAWSFLSVAWSPYRTDSLDWAIHLAATVTSFWILGHVLPLALQPLLAVLVVSASICALYAIDKALHDAAVGVPSRPYFGLMDPNTATVIFLVACGAAIYLCTNGNTVMVRLLGLASVLVFSCVVVLSLSRAAIPSLLLLFCASALLAALGFLPRRRAFTLLAVVIGTGAFAVVFSLGLASAGLNVPGTSVPASRPVTAFLAFSETRLGDFSAALLGDSTGRAEIWGAYWGIRDEWLPTGLGAGVDAKVLDTSGVLEDPRFDGGLRDTHNIVLQLLVQMGIPGFLAGAAMLCLFAWRAIQRRRAPVALLMLIGGLPMGLTLAIFDLAVLWVPFAVASVPIALITRYEWPNASPQRETLPG